MDKRRVADFDQDVCSGEAAGVSGVCPHRERTEDAGGGGIIGRLAQLEGFAIEAATGEEQHKCGMCGCPLANLAAMNVAPTGCPRIELHDR